jgi:hypothetical protein
MRPRLRDPPEGAQGRTWPFSCGFADKWFGIVLSLPCSRANFWVLSKLSYLLTLCRFL